MSPSTVTRWFAKLIIGTLLCLIAVPVARGGAEAVGRPSARDSRSIEAKRGLLKAAEDEAVCGVCQNTRAPAATECDADGLLCTDDFGICAAGTSRLRVCGSPAPIVNAVPNIFFNPLSAVNTVVIIGNRPLNRVVATRGQCGHAWKAQADAVLGYTVLGRAHSLFHTIFSQSGLSIPSSLEKPGEVRFNA